LKGGWTGEQLNLTRAEVSIAAAYAMLHGFLDGNKSGAIFDECRNNLEKCRAKGGKSALELLFFSRKRRRRVDGEKAKEYWL